MTSAKQLTKNQALTKIRDLFVLAKAAVTVDQAQARRYVYKARALAMLKTIRLTSALRRQFCRSCDSYLLSGVSARVRTRENTLIITCMHCGKIQRIPLSTRKK
ncbi:MAG TPA: ribonuclease P [Acidobacteriota bacterium]|nr:ribonuclease P [Acidobacteriota bacterium]